MKHKVIIEVDIDENTESEFAEWVAAISTRWAAAVVHETDGRTLATGANAAPESRVSAPTPQQQWFAEEFYELNKELADGWQEVGKLLESRNPDSTTLDPTKDAHTTTAERSQQQTG